VEPRVFITYAGTMDNVITLAHELGHAWHNWLIRDLPMSQRSYPMTLAETASIFAETLVRSALYEQARSAEERLAIAWADADGAATFLVNIPARFDFERALVAEREQGYVSSARLKGLTDEAWGRWYEQSLDRYHPCSGPPRRTSPSRASVFTTTPTSLAICSASGSISS
jgi:oligoendopeptidase F